MAAIQSKDRFNYYKDSNTSVVGITNIDNGGGDGDLSTSQNENDDDKERGIVRTMSELETEEEDEEEKDEEQEEGEEGGRQEGEQIHAFSLQDPSPRNNDKSATNSRNDSELGQILAARSNRDGRNQDSLMSSNAIGHGMLNQRVGERLHFTDGQGDYRDDRSHGRTRPPNNASRGGGDAVGFDVDDAVRLEAGMHTVRESTNTAPGTMEGGEGHEHGEQQDNGEETGDRHQTYYQDIGFLATLKKMFFGARDPESDLSVEMLEELHMVTGFTAKELRLTRSHFLSLVGNPSRMTREEFLAIPSVANNPLRERLLVCFGFDTVDSLDFKRDQKLRVAFTLVDIDGDGQVSQQDLVRYLELITAAPEGVKLDLDAVAARVIEEGASTQGSKTLSLADFIKIMGAADFDDKLSIPL